MPDSDGFPIKDDEPYGALVKAYIAAQNAATLASALAADTGGGGAVTSVAGRTGAVALSTTDISGLGTAATSATTDFDAAGTATTAVAAEASTRAVADTTNANAISAETTRATAAEGTNASAISTETSRATTAEGTKAAKGANSDITSLSGLTTPLSVPQGGSGAATLSGLVKGNGTSAMTAVTAPSGAVVGTTDSQTLTNKTLTSPAITTPTGIVKGDVGLGNVDNTADASKPVSTAQAAADAAVQAASQPLNSNLTAVGGFSSRDASHYLRGDGWQTFSQLVTDLNLSTLSTFSLLLAGMTVPTNSLDNWKAGFSRPATKLVGAIDNSQTTLVQTDIDMTPTTLHRVLTLESGSSAEEVYTTAGEADATTSITGITSVASTGIFTKTAHGLSVGQQVIPASGVLDSFLTVGTAYYVTSTNFTSSTFSLATSTVGAVLTGTTNDTNLTLTLHGVLTVVRGVNGFTAQAHAAGTSIHAPKYKTVIHLGDSIVEGLGGSAHDSWSDRASRMLGDKMGGLIARSWGEWRNQSSNDSNGEWTFHGTVSQSGTNVAYDVGWEGSFIIASGTGSSMVWTRPAGESVAAIDVLWVDWSATAFGWSYSLDGGSTWIDNPIQASIYSGSGVAPLRRSRIACSNPTEFRVRGATAAGTGRTVVMSNVPITTWRSYPYANITEGVHWANLGHFGIKLRTLLNARGVADGVTNGSTTLTSATASFVAADANSAVYLNGVRHTIASVTNSTTVVLNDSPVSATGVRVTIMQSSEVGDRFAQFLGHRGAWFPNLVIIGPYTNDIVDFTVVGTDGDYNFYGDMLQYLWDKISPVADIMFVSPHEKSTGVVTALAQSNYRAKVHSIAAANGAAVLDLYDAFSAYGFTGYAAVSGAGYMVDTVHFNWKGNNWMGAHLNRTLSVI